MFDLNMITAREMYKVTKNTAAVLSYTGTPVKLPLTITLKSGNNYIPCPYQTQVSIIDHMPTRADGSDYTYGDSLIDQNSDKMEFFNQFYGWFGTLASSNFEPGKGYVLTVVRGGDYIFPVANATRR